MSGPFVVAVDAGGTHTRVDCISPVGELLASARGSGGSPNHNHDAATTVSATIATALDDGGLRAEDAAAVGAGIAGLSLIGTGDHGSADDFFAVAGLRCPRVLVGDEVIAHRGALAGRPGVVVVAGTGSIILAITTAGEEIDSGAFDHYAGAARHLVRDVVERVLTADPLPVDDPVTPAVLAHWGATDLDELRLRVPPTSGRTRHDRNRQQGAFAPTVTALADDSAIADAALHRLVHATLQGVRLLAPMVRAGRTPVALVGSLATDPAFERRLRVQARTDRDRLEVTTAALDPVGGAAVLALDHAGFTVGDDVRRRLALRHPADGSAATGPRGRPGG